jgi:hypothetical protein
MSLATETGAVKLLTEEGIKLGPVSFVVRGSVFWSTLRTLSIAIVGLDMAPCNSCNSFRNLATFGISLLVPKSFARTYLCP